MNSSAVRSLRQKLAAGQSVFGLWITLESPSITEIAVALGLDWVVIDAEHGHLDWKEIVEHLRTTVRSDTVALVRIAELNGGLIKRALDVGADGVVVPWVESAEQLAQAVRFARYPPEGVRGIGAERATGWGQCLKEHTAEANDHVLVIPIIETVRTAGHVPEMCTVEGVELMFFGPADYSSTAGYRGQWEGPGVAKEILRLKDVIRQAGKHCGVVATGNENVQQRMRQGFRMIGLGMDTGMLLRSLHESLTSIGGDRQLRADFAVLRSPSVTPDARSIKQASPFQIGLTGDFYDSEGKPRYRDIGLGLFHEASGIEIQRFTDHRAEIGVDQIAESNGIIVLTPRVTSASLASSANLLAIGRFGVGYDSVDVKACTNANVVLFIAAGAVDRSVAEATLAWMLSLTHHVRTKDRLVREGRWNERSEFMGSELRDRTLGVVGFGGIGRTLVRLLARFGMNPPLVYDPYLTEALVAEQGASPVALDELLSQADFVSIHCPLTEKTRNLISARELDLMKPTSYLIDTARGGIVDEDALYAALTANRIAGAALDCFINEPLVGPSRFAHLDNVLLAPHSIAWTDELFRDIGRSICQGMLDLRQGRRPIGVVNPEVFDRPDFQEKWKRICNFIE